MGRSTANEHQKHDLVVKNSFLEYVVDQTNSNAKSLRQRSWTEPPKEEISYGQVRDNFHQNESCVDPNLMSPFSHAGTDPFTITTPEASPLQAPMMHPMFNQMFPEGFNQFMPPPFMQGGMPEQWAPAGYGMNMWQPAPDQSLVTGDTANKQNAAQNKTADPIAMFGKSVEYKLMPIAEEPPASAETRTSVMLRGLPEVYNRTLLLRLLESQGFFGRFNFVYLPVDFKRSKNLGYALVNLVNPGEALRFWRHFHNFAQWGAPGGSAGTLEWCSPQQGLESHIERYRNSPVMHESVPDEWRPMLLAHGVPVTFPAPTTRIKAPKMKGHQ